MKTEKTLAVIFVFALAVKFFDVTGSSLLLVISLTLLSMLYFPMAFYFFCDKNIKMQNLPLSIFGGMMLAMIPIGVMFKLMIWPGSFIQLFMGLFLSAVLLAAILVLKQKADKELKVYFKNFLQRTVFWLAFGLVLFFTPTSSIIKLQYRHEPELVRLKLLIHEHPGNPEYQYELQRYYIQRDSAYVASERKH